MIGVMPYAVLDLERRGKTTPAETTAARRFCTRIRPWDADAKDHFHRTMCGLGRHSTVAEMMFIAQMTVRDIARFTSAEEADVEARVIAALVALNEFGGMK